MENKRIIKAFSILCVSVSMHTCYAADSLSHKYPAAVLVELKSESNRINALLKDKRYKEMEEVRNDAAGEDAAMVNDFKDHFHYCPVYYFMDTNQHYIVQKQFDGILLDTNLNPAKDIIIDAASRDYVIVNYGYPVTQPHHQKVVKDSAKYLNSTGEPMGMGLIINNDKMEQLNYLYRLGYDEAALGEKARSYAYSSKHFDIEYFPAANDFNNKLKKRKNTHRVNKMNRRISNGA